MKAKLARLKSAQESAYRMKMPLAAGLRNQIRQGHANPINVLGSGLLRSVGEALWARLTVGRNWASVVKRKVGSPAQ